MVSSFFVGLDLGQRQDYTAIAVVERAETVGEWDAARWAYRKLVTLQLRLLKRVPLGTPYPEVVEGVAALTRSRELAGRCTLVVDGTGVGAPVVDLLRAARHGASLMAATITGADRESSHDGYHRIPKRDLIIGLQVLLQQGELQIAERIPFGAELRAEMAQMRVRATLAGHEQYGAWREGTHDDLVFAVALACWAAGKAPGGGWWVNREGEALMKMRARLG